MGDTSSENKKMIENITPTNFAEKIYDNDGPKIVVFSSATCAPCQAMKPALEQISTDVKVFAVDALDKENEEA
jgi:thioredoxin-like negative regulator of GroEL